MDVDIIIQMGFFLCDLHRDITKLHSTQFHGQTSSQSFIVYRGQSLSQIDFNQLTQNQGGLLAFNNFLSTSKNRKTSLKFIKRNLGKIKFVSILFVMRIDPLIQSTSFADVAGISPIGTEEEILFSMHSVFRIDKIKQLPDNNQIWEAELTLTDDNDPRLHELSETIQKETSRNHEWNRLGRLLIILAKFDKAEKLYEILLRQTTDKEKKAIIFHQLGKVNQLQGEYSKALESYEKSLEINQTALPVNHPVFATSYNNIGLVYQCMGKYSKALEYYEKSLEITKKTLPAYHPHLATSYSNLGSVYRNMGAYSKALEYYEKSVEIMIKTLSANHPSLAALYNNIGLVYDNTGEYSKALEYYEKSLEIVIKTLPAYHPDLATSYNNIGNVYDSMGEYSKALEYYEKLREIREKALPVNHASLPSSEGHTATSDDYIELRLVTRRQ